jgi:hypothetical protein
MRTGNAHDDQAPLKVCHAYFDQRRAIEAAGLEA